jgi:hypothetical protein
MKQGGTRRMPDGIAFGVPRSRVCVLCKIYQDLRTSYASSFRRRQIVVKICEAMRMREPVRMQEAMGMQEAMRMWNVGMLLNASPCQNLAPHDMIV